MTAKIELRDLHHVLLLAEEMNFSRAALRANLSQTAFSRSIQAIEQRYGLRLFDRSTRRVSPTAACRQLLGSGRELLARAQELSREMLFLAGSLGGELRFGASLLGVDCFLQGLLPALRQQSPHLRLQIEVGQWSLLLGHLEAERIEFFVAYPDTLADDPRFQVTPLPAQAASVFCRASHPLTGSQHPLQFSDLLPYPWACIQFAQEINEQFRRLSGVQRVEDLPLAMGCDNKDLLREMTLHSDHLLFTWSHWLAQDVAQGRLVDLKERMLPLVPKAIFQLPCAIVRLADRTPSPLAKALIRLIEDRSVMHRRTDQGAASC
ncbi:MAG: LysR family transcriptional regulator [Burkholderiaceae bacterium]|nr:LysR family transcriptional regulator [Pseudomonadota bacterium]MBS0597472.1 LysR family transcriptional regulator [Pseudomonadota bacterium]MCO5114808.1 LysR family transcriptional regulator [Burkholderiaceae bacterium]MCP5218804.1 LysR family transcriptional regulator [Burkholderiaceae bacterium]